MKIAILGSGGREHAIAYSISKSKKVKKIYCIPGNAGTEEIAENETSTSVLKMNKLVMLPHKMSPKNLESNEIVIIIGHLAQIARQITCMISKLHLIK